MRHPRSVCQPGQPLAHYETTGPEPWRDTEGRITHFVSAMGTTGTDDCVSRFLKRKNADIQIVGAQPEEGSRIPGIRKWPEAYMPKIYDPKYIDRTESVSQSDAEHMARRMVMAKAFFVGSLRRVRLMWRCVWQRKLKTPRSFSCSVRPGRSLPVDGRLLLDGTFIANIKAQPKLRFLFVTTADQPCIACRTAWPNFGEPPQPRRRSWVVVVACEHVEVAQADAVLGNG
ncbi:pyridoxal-phosphate dependent enzyme [Bradyrhizobium betae]